MPPPATSPPPDAPAVKHLGWALRQRREQRALTREELRDVLGYGVTVIKDVERGVYHANLAHYLARWREVFGLDPELQRLWGRVHAEQEHERQRKILEAQGASLHQTGKDPDQDDDVRRAAFLKLAAAGGLVFADAGLRDLVHANPHPSGTPVFTPLAATSWAAPIHQAVLDPTGAAHHAGAGPLSGQGPELKTMPQLRGSAERVIRASLASDYIRLRRSLPTLIGQLELAALQGGEADRPGLQRLRSDVYAVAGWTLIKADGAAAAWVAAQRAVQLAEQADDVLRCAAAMRCLAEVHMRAGDLEQAVRSAFLAATYLDTARTTEPASVMCLRGAALLSAAAAAARRGDHREAFTALKAAEVCAEALGEDHAILGAVFGPTNVAIHKVAVAVELGLAKQALDQVPRVRLGRMPTHLTERRARFLIDVARGHAQLQDHPAAVNALLQAEKVAPHEVRHHRLTHQLVRSLMSRQHPSSELRALADRSKLLN